MPATSSRLPRPRPATGGAGRCLAALRPSLLTAAVALGLGYLSWTHPLLQSIPRIAVVGRGNRTVGRTLVVGEARVVQALRAAREEIATATPGFPDRSIPFLTPPSVDGGSMGSTQLRAT